MTKIKQLPKRSQVKPADQWDLASLFPDDAAWEAAFRRWEKRIAGFENFRGQLASGPKAIAACLKFDVDFDRAGERLGTYAFLKTAEDTANSTYQRMHGRYQNVASRAGQLASFIRPEITGHPLGQDGAASWPPRSWPSFAWSSSGMLRYKPHTLSRQRGKAARHAGRDGRHGPNQMFRQLNDADLKFGPIKNERGETVELSHASFSAFLHSPKRNVPQAAFHQYYAAIRGPRKHAGRHAVRLGPARRLLRQGPELSQRARVRPVSRQGAAVGLRQPDRLRAPQPPRLVPLLRTAAAEDEAERHPPLRHLRADPQRAGTRHTWNQAVEARDPALEPLGSRILRRAGSGLSRPLVRPLSEPREAERRVQLRARSTASRTS